MKKINEDNFFIITRLDLNEESDSLSNIYDLSILNEIKERKDYKKNKIKKYFKNLINHNDTKKFKKDTKFHIIKLIKKAILSSNLTYKWKIATFRNILIFFHIFFFISVITFSIDKNRDNIQNNIINSTSIDINISYSFNDSNIFTNSSENDSYTIKGKDSESSKDKIKKNKLLLIKIIMNQIILIPIWFFFKYKLIPKWNKINEIIYKITNHLILCESNNNNNFFYYLMKDFSIFITKKKYYNENKDILPISLPKNEYLYRKNILLYCINIINDFILEERSFINYHELIPADDYNDIKVLTKYMEKNLQEKMRIFNKKILSPLAFSIIIGLFYKKTSFEYLIFSIIFLSLILLLCEKIFKEYIRKYKLNIDKFIDSYNEILIKKKRFIYRKNKLFMYLALNGDNYNKNLIINFIEKIAKS